LDLFKALRIAIRSEVGAHEMYVRLAEETSDPEAKALFKHLAEYETMHQQFLEAERLALTGGDGSNEGRSFHWSELMQEESNTSDEEGSVALPLNLAAARDVIKLLKEVNRELSQRQSIHERELAIAADIQAKLLPQEIPENRDIQIAASNIMARSVGGDYYDFIANDHGKLAVIVADSMGKGMPGALLMTTARTIWRSLSLSDLITPGKALKLINHAIYDDMQATQAFVTMFVAFYDSDRSILHYSSAGHNPALIYTPVAKYCRELDVGGPPIGLFPDSEFPSDELYLNSGDLMVIYTDGIVESVNDKNELFGVEKLCNIIYKNRNLNAEDIKDKILEGVNDYTLGNPQSDDITMVIMRRRQYQ